jgi:putative Ca2+/H+ antiporter (TMEM165/GDT1 family)
MGGSFLQGFYKSIGIIFASEIGDKTFFIAAIMAMRHPRLLVCLLWAGSVHACDYSRIESFGAAVTMMSASDQSCTLHTFSVLICHAVVVTW